jgi:hypothetical protein
MASSSSNKRKRDDNDESDNDATRAFNINDKDILEIVCIVRASDKKNINVTPNIFSVNHTATRTRFSYNKYVCEVNVGSDNMSTLPDFLNNMRRMFSYFINVMKYKASSGKDKARFYPS